MPTWSSDTNPAALFLLQDAYRVMFVDYFDVSDDVFSDYRCIYYYVGYEVGQSYAPHSTTNITKTRSMLCAPNSAFSINGVIYPSTALSALYINNGTIIVSGSHGKINSLSYRIYGCHILDVLEWRHYSVPCERVSDGKQGLYDVVDSLFCPIVINNQCAFSRTSYAPKITFSQPVTSKLTIKITKDGASSSTTVSFAKGSSSLSLDSTYQYATINSISPAYDDTYVYFNPF